ncbi:MAG: chemotaxis protein CheW [Treponemataceae bacterium]|nr:chemotaxis protein CheW [Treponemataceae bacterium]
MSDAVMNAAAVAEAAVEAREDKVVILDFKMVTFSLADKDYAIDIMQIKEIVKADKALFTYMPNALPFVLGVYNSRGDIIPIIDLRIFFNIEMDDHKDSTLENILMVRVGEQVFGVVVDNVDKVVSVQKSMIQPPHPLFGDINIKYIQGVVETNNRMYVLLDVERILGSKLAVKDTDSTKANTDVQMKLSAGSKKAKQAAMPKKETKAVDYSFITSGLATLRKFTVTPINEKWVKTRFDEWYKERGKDKLQFQDPTDADAFLKPFYSPYNGAWWKKDYADAIYKALPDNTAKQIVVWNPGCGKGQESYSLACLLRKRYPDARIRIYAHDIDLLSVSNAPLISIPADVANDWYAPYVTRKTNGDLTFTPEVRESVMFEYHDCVNTTALPDLDMVFTRDFVSFQPEKAQEALIEDFADKLKGNGIVILGQNESLESNKEWTAKAVGSIKTFGKQ